MTVRRFSRRASSSKPERVGEGLPAITTYDLHTIVRDMVGREIQVDIDEDFPITVPLLNSKAVTDDPPVR